MIVRSSEVEPILMMKGVWRRTLRYGERVMLAHFTLEEGAIIPPHSHPHEQVGYVIKGEVAMTIADETYSLRGGDSYLAPANVEHSAKAIKRSVVIDAFSPPREDYK